MFAAGTDVSQAQPVDQASPIAASDSAHPYTTALGALANYQSCGVHARAAILAELNRSFREGEAAARAKGLGPRLDELRRRYEAMLAVADIAACGGGPVAALANARASLRAFQVWVAAQPPTR